MDVMCYLDSVRTNWETHRQIVQSLREQCSEAACLLSEEGQSSGELAKWDSAHKDLIILSVGYPNNLLVLYIETEFGDHSVVYAKGGRGYEIDGKIVYPAFDERLLEDL